MFFALINTFVITFHRITNRVTLLWRHNTRRNGVLGAVEARRWRSKRGRRRGASPLRQGGDLRRGFSSQRNTAIQRWFEDDAGGENAAGKERRCAVELSRRFQARVWIKRFRQVRILEIYFELCYLFYIGILVQLEILKYILW